MKNRTVTFEDFATEKLSKNQQKTILGGGDPTDPVKGNGKGNGESETVKVEN